MPLLSPPVFTEGGRVSLPTDRSSPLKSLHSKSHLPSLQTGPTHPCGVGIAGLGPQRVKSSALFAQIDSHLLSLHTNLHPACRAIGGCGPHLSKSSDLPYIPAVPVSICLNISPGGKPPTLGLNLAHSSRLEGSEQYSMQASGELQPPGPPACIGACLIIEDVGISICLNCSKRSNFSCSISLNRGGAIIPC